MTPLFSDHFDLHAAWRRDITQRLEQLGGWLRDHELLDPALDERLRRLQAQVREDKVMVAFVAEFSRGKSELINAIFFPGHGRRIMPASAGRTTMCPTELGWDGEQAPGLRLLPIETRLEPTSLAEWRQHAGAWETADLDIRDPARLAHAMERVAEVRRASVDEARALGLWHDDSPEDNPRLLEGGEVEIPRWRHALVNLPHPLLKQGLVILDTPGLNAIGAEPELTVSLLPQAQAVVFILAADTGVTRSDLAIWREHLGVAPEQSHARLVVLNKIDTLWDPLRTPQEVQDQIDRQRQTCAEVLDLPLDQVLPVSAQKGLVAKIQNDTGLLVDSHLPELELALAHGLLGKRQQILREAVHAGIGELRAEAARALSQRRRELAEQLMELRGLRGKNLAVIRHLRARITQEQSDFDDSGSRIQAVRSVHMKLLRELMDMLGSDALRSEMAELTATLRQPGIKLGVRKAYDRTFGHLRAGLGRAQSAAAEIQSMLAVSFRQLNAEHGFSLQPPPMPDFRPFLESLDAVERSHQQYLGLGHILKLARPDFVERLVRALTSRLRELYESALGEVELWNKSAASQLDAQLRERRRNFSRRIEGVERVQQAAATLDERIAQLEAQEAVAQALTQRLEAFGEELGDLCAPVPGEALQKIA
ncbi:dynamin family protein [Ramlibacter sp. MAHUQ-53]|uniref:dynamin family protein n=1 Tax=unclassified Ramlibacter TaxID=2617605 RepID=UPI0036406312